MVIARHGDHAAVTRGASAVGVLEHIRAAIHAGALAVPDAEHPVEFVFIGKQIELLRTPDGGGRQFLVDPGLEHHVVGLEDFFGLPQRLVVATQRRAAVARDEARGVEPDGGIALPLQHGQTHQRLNAAHEGAAGI